MPRIVITQVAASVPFDNSTNGFTATNVQAAIEEAKAAVSSFASPGFVFTRSGLVPTNTWLQVGAVPSNQAGNNFPMYNGVLTSIAVANGVASTFGVEVYEHDGTTYTLLATVSVVAARADEFDSTDFGVVSITRGKELAVKISSGQATNPVISIQLTGTVNP